MHKIEVENTWFLLCVHELVKYLSNKDNVIKLHSKYWKGIKSHYGYEKRLMEPKIGIGIDLPVIINSEVFTEGCTVNRTT